MNKWLVLFIVFALLPFNFLALRAQKLNQTKLPFEVNYATFRASKGFDYLEVYSAIYRSQLKFVKDSTHHFRANFRLEIDIVKDDSVLFKDTAKKVTYTDSLSKVSRSQKLPDVSRVYIRPGDYNLRVTARDLNSKHFGTIKMPIHVRSYSKDSLDISTIELASLIRKNKKPEMYTKNGYQVVPNPGALYGQGAPMLYFYSEIYNFKKSTVPDSYRVNYQIMDRNGKVVRDYPPIMRHKPGDSAVEVGGLNIITLPSGSYFFKITASDLGTGQKSTSRRKFFVYRESDFVHQKQKEGSKRSKLSRFLNSPEYQVYDEMSAKAINAEFNGASYLATGQEKKIFKSLDLDGKREFMKRFWLRRDQDPTTLKNEFRQDYLQRLAYVTSHFGAGKPGWKSDRGRVYLIYGKPNEIERYPNSSETKAYQIWHYYNIQGGVNFYFIDIRGFGDYQLVHSTARNELQDYNWQRWLRPF